MKVKIVIRSRSKCGEPGKKHIVNSTHLEPEVHPYSRHFIAFPLMQIGFTLGSHCVSEEKAETKNEKM